MYRFKMLPTRSTVLILVTLWLQTCSGDNGSGGKTTLHFSYITTVTGDLTIAGAIPAVDLALEQINNRTDILPDYTLSYTMIRDSKVLRNRPSYKNLL